jgi:RNA polymerase sigma-70 factor (ECF subfamily)
MQSDSDETLLKQWIHNRDKHSFKQLYLRYRSMVYRISKGYLGNDKDAEDITQEIFIKTLLNKAEQFTGKSFKAWLSTIVRNTCIDMIRARKATKIDGNIDMDGEEFLDKLNLNMDNVVSSPEDTVSSMQQQRCNQELVWDALDKLPIKQREVVILRYFSELSSKEISTILQCGENNVNVNLHHALKKLTVLSQTMTIED